MEIRIKRAYTKPARSDGYRVLVDRIWPRGVSKEDAELDDWMKEIAPSSKLRKWFDHDPDRWEEFKHRYFDELDNKSKELNVLRNKAKIGRITLVYSAKDEEHNNAVALKEYLNEA
jgi:uncharacterized protein YeaO (DUF488 family)